MLELLTPIALWSQHAETFNLMDAMDDNLFILFLSVIYLKMFLLSWPMSKIPILLAHCLLPLT